MKAITVCWGASRYTQLAIDQAAACGADVVALSDHPYRHCEYVDIHELESAATEFDRLYFHRNSNPPKFNYMAWRRWFVLQKYLEKSGENHCFAFDGDLMLLRSPDALAPDLNTVPLAACRPRSAAPYFWAVSGHASFWTRATLEEFCHYTLELLAQKDSGPLHEKWRHHESTDTPGGICDMTAIHLLWERLDARGQTPLNLLEAQQGRVFDNLMGSADNLEVGEFALHHGRKSLPVWQNRLPHPYSAALRSRTAMVALHFQGQQKRRMPRFRFLHRYRLEHLINAFL